MLIYEYTAVCIFHKTLLIYVKKKINLKRDIVEFRSPFLLAKLLAIK